MSRQPPPSPPRPRRRSARASHAWTFLTNHTHVLVCIGRDPDVLLRDIAAQVGVTERAVQSIVADLELAGVLRRQRVGRRNRYEFDAAIALRHPLEGHRTIGELLAALRA